MVKVFDALEQAANERATQGRDGQGDPIFSGNKLLESPTLDIESKMVVLYHNIEPLLHENQAKVVQFMSSGPNEGTAQLLREFAKVCAGKFHKTVLILDANVLEPTQYVYFNVSPEWAEEGSTEAKRDIKDAVCRVGKTNLFVCQVVTQRSLSPTSLEVEQFERLLDQLRPGFDIILVDAPPATLSPIGLNLGAAVDGVVLVVEAEKTRWQVAEKVKNSIETRGGKVLGAILNRSLYHIPRLLYDLL